MPTPAEIKDRLRKAGRTAADVARELNVSRKAVYRVLSGRSKGRHGDAHKVAVALGLKDGVIVPDDMPVGEALKQSGGE